MGDLLLSLSPDLRDAALVLALLAVPLLIAATLLRGFDAAPLMRALLWRFRGANLTFVLLIAISLAVSVAITAQERGLRNGTARAADKFDLVITAPGSEMTMTLATVFLQPTDAQLLDGHVYAEIAGHKNVALAAPLAFGDSYGEAPVVGTTAAFVEHLAGGAVAGRLWTRRGEAIVGAAVPLEIGAAFRPLHGHGDAAHAHAHDSPGLTVVGKIPPSGTPWDRAILVPIEAVWQAHELGTGHAPGDTRLGPPFDAERFPGTPAVIVRGDTLWASYALRSEFTRAARTMAFFPGTVLAELYRVMGDVRQVMSLMSLVTQGLVAAAVLLGLFILTRLFQRQVAMLRALGAPGRFVAGVVWGYAAALLLAGAALGILLGYAATAVFAHLIATRTDVVVEATLGWPELQLAAAFFALTAILALAPALLVLRQPIPAGLRS